MEAGDELGKKRVHQSQRKQNSWINNIEGWSVKIDNMNEGETEVGMSPLSSE